MQQSSQSRSAEARASVFPHLLPRVRLDSLELRNELFENLELLRVDVVHVGAGLGELQAAASALDLLAQLANGRCDGVLVDAGRVLDATDLVADFEGVERVGAVARRGVEGRDPEGDGVAAQALLQQARQARRCVGHGPRVCAIGCEGVGNFVESL